MPESMARWLDGDVVATNVTVDEHGLTIINSGADGARPSPPRRVPNEAIANHPLLRELVSTSRERVRLVLTSDQAMVKTITLPLATEENLREVVGFELDRHTPFTPNQAYYDVQVLKRDVAQEKITVSLAIASKSVVAALLETLRRGGLTCTAIGIDVKAAGNAMEVDLQPVGDKPPRRLSRRHQMNFGLLGIAILLGIVAVVLPIWQKREAVKVLIPQAEKTGAEFKLSERVYAEYAKLASEYNFLATKKYATYPVVTVIEELAQTFPDTTWVQKLDIKANGKLREVVIMGEAQSASRVIENLEQSPRVLFQNSKQLTPTSKMQANTERFHVSAEIKSRQAPPVEILDEQGALGAASVVQPTASSASAPSAGTATVVSTPQQSMAPAANVPNAGQSGAVMSVPASPPGSPRLTQETIKPQSAKQGEQPTPASPVRLPPATVAAPGPANAAPVPSAPAHYPPTIVPDPSTFVSPPISTYGVVPGPQSPPTIVPDFPSAPAGKKGGS